MFVTAAGELAATLVKAVIVFVSTNVDDIVILTVLFADPQLRPRSIVVGQYAGISALFLVSAAAGAAAIAIPAGWVSLLGAVPLVLGLQKGFAVLRTRGSGDEEDASGALKGGSQVLAVAGVTLANGADNLGVYIPIFAVERRAIIVYAVVFAVMVALWCALGFKLVNNRAVGTTVRRYGHVALPIVLVLLGVHILWGMRSVL